MEKPDFEKRVSLILRKDLAQVRRTIEHYLDKGDARSCALERLDEVEMFAETALRQKQALLEIVNSAQA